MSPGTPAVGDLDRGDSLLEDGVIVEVAERIDVPDAEVIEAGRPFPQFAGGLFQLVGVGVRAVDLSRPVVA
ncbi:hypothetical protein [Streptomyces atratus]|uniref:Uncharacterized protein n=1 Tax=Streptomyces atratus TaxID=1893 RepID=A0A2Z5JNB7_STRAR|nr:hypothetical protein [Streptomyces atratus]AXE81926.1 hypothetical protein C5746_38985 [Streptomyces atratus]